MTTFLLGDRVRLTVDLPTNRGQGPVLPAGSLGIAAFRAKLEPTLIMVAFDEGPTVWAPIDSLEKVGS